MKNNWRILSLVILMLIFINCGQGNGNGNGNPPDNPIPVLSSISPNSKVSHMPSFTLSATGSNFVSGSKIVFNDIEKQTTFVSSTELTCQIDPADISGSTSLTLDSLHIPEASEEVAIVKVRNPSPGGGDSNSLDFLIQSNHTFYVPKNISSNSGYSYVPVIAIDSAGNINVVWYDKTPGNYDIFYSRSENNGGTWTQPVNLSSNAGQSYGPDIVTDSEGNINVVWCDRTPGNYDIFYSRSENNGGTWTQAVNLSNNMGESASPVIAIDSAGNINVVWHDYTPGNYEIFYSRSENNGNSWAQAKNISSNAGQSYGPDIVTDSEGNINVVWCDRTPGNYDIFYSRSENNGGTWTQAVNLSNNAGNSTYPAIATDSAGNINVVWYDKTPGNLEIFFTRSENNGGSWTQPVNLSNNAGNSYDPTISTDSAGNINVVWYDYTPGNLEIFYGRSINNGSSWTQPKNISNNTGNSAYPAIATDSAGNINVVWQDETPGNLDIFFTSSTH